MFNFDTDVVINKLEATDIIAGADLLVVKRIGNYKKGTVVIPADDVKLGLASGVITGSADVCGKYTVAVAAKAADAEAIRLLIKIKCSEKYGEFALANWHSFEKPVMVEGVDQAAIMKALKESIDADIATVDEAAGTIEFTESIFSIDVNEAKAYDLVPVTTESGAQGYFDYIEKEQAAAPVSETAAPVIGKGTYGQIISNLRFPTHENVRFASPNEDEMPIKGALYDAVVFDIVTERQNPAGGLSAAGQVITSKTHHVIYVNQNCTKKASDLATALAAMA